MPLTVSPCLDRYIPTSYLCLGTTSSDLACSSWPRGSRWLDDCTCIGRLPLTGGQPPPNQDHWTAENGSYIPRGKAYPTVLLALPPCCPICICLGNPYVCWFECPLPTGPTDILEPPRHAYMHQLSVSRSCAASRKRCPSIAPENLVTRRNMQTCTLVHVCPMRKYVALTGCKGSDAVSICSFHANHIPNSMC